MLLYLGHYLLRMVIPALGSRKLRELSADDIDRWIAGKAKTLSTDTLRILHSIVRRSITRAQARDKVKRNVVLLCDVPQGRRGRPSKSLSYDQAAALLAAAEDRPLYAYIVVSLLTGARTEELRALTWSHVQLDASRPSSWSGVLSALAATPRPGSHAARLSCRIAAPRAPPSPRPAGPAPQARGG
jgi:integrase